MSLIKNKPFSIPQVPITEIQTENNLTLNAIGSNITANPTIGWVAIETNIIYANIEADPGDGWVRTEFNSNIIYGNIEADPADGWVMSANAGVIGPIDYGDIPSATPEEDTIADKFIQPSNWQIDLEPASST